MGKRIPARALIECILCARCNSYATATGGGICAACVLTAERDQLRAEVETLSNNARHYADRCTEVEARCKSALSNSKQVQDGWSEALSMRDAATDRAEAAEKDAADCRAEYGQLYAKAGAMSDKLIAAESTASGLRRALEDCLDTAKSYRSDILGLHCESLPTDPYFEHNHAPNRCDRDKVILEATTALAASPNDHARRIKAEALRRQPNWERSVGGKPSQLGEAGDLGAQALEAWAWVERNNATVDPWSVGWACEREVEGKSTVTRGKTPLAAVLDAMEKEGKG